MNLKYINLAFRFLLEVVSLVVFGSRGSGLAQSRIRFIGMIGVPFAAAALWGIFAVPDDPSRSGKAPVRYPACSVWFWRLSFLQLQF